MATVVLVVHPRRPNAASHARQVAAWLAERGHRVVIPEDDAGTLGLSELGVPPRDLSGPPPAGPARDPGPGPDVARDQARDANWDPALVVALGGDGTVLRAVRMVADRGVPVLGVNLGHLGFLTQVEPEEAVAALDRFFAGDCAVEDRMLLSVAIVRASAAAGQKPDTTLLALNEAVLEKPRPGSSVHLSATVGGRGWTTYNGDGLIVATPTGSTAYSFSARGPVVSPTMRAIVLTPVSAHMAFDRSLVVGAGEVVRVEVSSDRPAALTVDGRDRGLLRRGDAIVCRGADRTARFVTFGDRDFFGALRIKLGMAGH